MSARTPQQPTLLWLYGGAVAVGAAFEVIQLILAVIARTSGGQPIPPVDLVMALMSATYAAAVGYSLLDDKPWARELFWYLYMKPNVVAYFRYLREHSGSLKTGRGD